MPQRATKLPPSRVLMKGAWPLTLLLFGWLAALAAAAYMPNWRLRISVVAVGWLLARLVTCKSTRSAVKGSLSQASPKFLASSSLAVAGVTLLGIVIGVHKFGWGETWQVLKDTYFSVLLVGLVGVLAASLATLLLVAIAATMRNALFSNRRTGAKSDSKPDLLKVLRQFRGEIIPLAWFCLIAWSPVLLGVSLRFLSSPVLWAAVLSLAGFMFAWWEGGETERVSGPPRARWGMAIAAIVTHCDSVWWMATSVYDWLIHRFLVWSAWSLEIVLPALVALAATLILLLILSIPFIWRLSKMDSLAIGWLRCYLAYDSCGRVYTVLRHIGHVVAHQYSPFRWLWVVLRWSWQCTLGKRPSWLLPHGFTGHSRYEQFLIHLIKRQDVEVRKRVRKWRVEALGESPGEAVCAVSARRELKRQARTLVALVDHIVCPYCRHGEDSAEDALLDLIDPMDRLRLACESLSPDPKGPFRAIHRRLRRLYRILGPAAEGSGDHPLVELAQFRLESMALARSNHTGLCGAAISTETGYGLPSRDDQWRWKWREKLGEWIRSWSESVSSNGRQIRSSQLAAHTMLGEMRTAEDWSDIVETCRLLIEGGYTLTASDHLDLGEACWRHAQYLENGTFYQWMWQQAVSHFFMAKAIEHLRDLPAPCEETDE